MTVSAAVPADAPVMIAWGAFKATDDYANTLRWSAAPDHSEGSLWNAFYRGFYAAALNRAEALPHPIEGSEPLKMAVGADWLTRKVATDPDIDAEVRPHQSEAQGSEGDRSEAIARRVRILVLEHTMGTPPDAVTSANLEAQAIRDIIALASISTPSGEVG